MLLESSLEPIRPTSTTSSRQMKIQTDFSRTQRMAGLYLFSRPYEALMLIPFSLLPYRAAYLLYLAFNVALIIPCFLVARDAFSTRN